ncbi:MAG TPA: SDR family NAD(P)-dependent oxidoreductase [Saprospiraceae bacterium]|nr:SDR family NAD(P)-dependent oxidoreductase [Saprospiraceae bacterium]
MTYLIIGAGPGIGMAVARRFGRGGFSVLLLARAESKLQQMVAELREGGIAAQGYAADIADAQGLRQVLNRAWQEHPDIRVLHYNASAFTLAPLDQLDPAVMLEDMKVNVVGGLVAGQAALRHWGEHKGGTLFFTGGGSGLNPSPEVAALGAGKAAMRNLVLSFAKHCAPLGIRVATVTVCGAVKPHTSLDPDLIAEEFWRLYGLPAGQWEIESVME